MKPRLFTEIPAGLAAVSLRLHGGAYCRPPISRMGNKAGYAECILGALGLGSGTGAGAYLWVEADDDVRGLLRAYPDAEMLRRIAEIIRGWAGEEPRALWERLRGERKARGLTGDADTAGWLYVAGGSMKGFGEGPFGGNLEGFEENAHGHSKRPLLDRLPDACHRLAEYAYVTGNAHGGTGGFKVVPTTRPNTEANLTPDGLASRFEGMARDVAETTLLHKWSFSEKGPDHGYGGPGSIVNAPGANWTTEQRDRALGCDRTASLVTATPGGWPPVAILAQIPTAAEVSALLGTPGDLADTVVYMDPDYQGTTGYRHTMPRALVVATALDFAALGATVCVSEAVAVEELAALGWYAVEITAGRKGQRRTFARVATEFLTLNREPAHRVATQPSLFTGAA